MAKTQAKQVELKQNKASIYSSREQKVSKRVAAWIVDFIVFLILATGFAFLTSFAYGYDNYSRIVNEKSIEYGVKVETEPDSGKYVFIDPESEGAAQKYELLYNDSEFIKAYDKQMNGVIIIISAGVACSLLIVELIMPVIFKHGRTLGMRFFDVGYVTDEGVDPPFKQIFIRFLFGKLILEGLIPVISLLYILHGSGFGLVGLIALVAIGGVNGYLLLIHRDRRGIHDYIARMRPIDNSNQIYIKSVEELAALKAEEAAGRK